MGNKFSASTITYYDIPMTDAVRRISDLGFDYVELFEHSWEFDGITEKLLKRIFANSRIKPVSWHDCPDSKFWAEQIEDVYCVVKQVRRRLDICAELDIKYLTLHYDFNEFSNTGDMVPGNHIIFNAFPEIIEYAKARNIVILFENGEKVLSEFLRLLCKQVNSPNVGVCLDIGHANLFEEVETTILATGSLVKHLHIHDNYGMRKDSGFSDLHLAPGEGSIDWRKCMEALKRINYQGVFNFELTCSQYARDGVADVKGFGNCLTLKERDKLLRQARKYLKQFLT